MKLRSYVLQMMADVSCQHVADASFWPQGIGDDDDAVEASSAHLRETEDGFQPVFFDMRPLRNLRLVDEVDSLSPVMDMQARSLPLVFFVEFS